MGHQESSDNHFCFLDGLFFFTDVAFEAWIDVCITDWASFCLTATLYSLTHPFLTGPLYPLRPVFPLRPVLLSISSAETLNMVSHAVTSNHTIISLLLHDCNFAFILKCNVNIWYAGYLICNHCEMVI